MSAVKACLFVAVLAFATGSVNAQAIPWTEKFLLMRQNASTTVTPLPVPECTSPADTNCWQQTSGQPDVQITSYSVLNEQHIFPCNNGGTTQTQFGWTNSVPITDGVCQSECEGFGCSSKTFHTCENFGFTTCPQPAGTFTSIGSPTKCAAGLGDYMLTIVCPSFTLVTYVSYG